MAALEQIQQLIEEVGPDLEAQAVLQDATDEWVLVYDEETFVEVGFRPDRKCLALSVALGSPDPDRQLETYKNLLAYAALSDQTGGVRIALDAPDGELIQLLDLFTEDLDRVTLLAVLANFIEKARAWRTMLAEGGIASSDLPEFEESGIPPGIRA